MRPDQDAPAIDCLGLTKRYADRTVALAGLTLSIPCGTSFGLLGENGAGKSTLVRLVMGYIFPTAGRVRVLGAEPVARAHAHVGYVHERPSFERRFTARRTLTYLAELSGLWGAAGRARVEDVLEQVGLRAAADRRTGTFSKGMLQRLAIAQALLTDPVLLILDEPTSGLDPGAQWEVRQTITGLRERGKTLLLCSHYLAEVEALCDTVGILRRGRLVQTGAVADLLRIDDAVEIVLAGERSAEDGAALAGVADCVVVAHGSALRVRADDQQSVLAALVANRISIRSLNPVMRSLEDVYVHATRTVPGTPSGLAPTVAGAAHPSARASTDGEGGHA